MNDTTHTPGLPSAPEPTIPGLPAELAHLFRHALRDQRIHPLMPMVQQYRQAAAAAGPKADTP
jgi:hypothetical protein